ncbi:unnamed protein product [Microthlaspi erraticum]|uniref:Reverse transcriptase domain-containing protein n=1 Tax=Microthlaspi erraticum TaxID=1685480 RepID=A0A6D2JUX7_9BRAS|nr:unnamed protein product [Microthlaspi erraticum]
METKNSEELVLKETKSLGYTSHFIVPPHGHGGRRLALLWNQKLQINIITATDNYIDASITYKDKFFYATFLYGEPDKTKRGEVWEQISDLTAARVSPWFLTGDFNDILDNTEKQGGPIRSEASFGVFREFMATNDLYDLQHTGNSLSWRGVRYDHLIHSRLDRAVANSAWSEMFPTGRSAYLRYEASDHRPIISFFEPTLKKRRGLFRYDRRMKNNEEIKKLVDKTWKANLSQTVQGKISACRREISRWNRKHHWNSKKIIEDLKKRLDEAMSARVPDEAAIQEINANLKTNYKKEEDFWKQRSMQLWLALRDKNTGYFHAVSRNRKRVNTIVMLEDKQGKACFEESEIATIISEYYNDLFTTIEEPRRKNIVDQTLSPCISQEENLKLIELPSTEEIKEALFSIHPDKAPGPDGFSACFFQTHWEVVGESIVEEVGSFFSSGILPTAINNTHVRLIPKTPSPKGVADYRPIALCNFYYKIIAKVLTRRLQPILNDIIVENQSAFVLGRAISDNMMITHEVMHFLKVSGAKKHCSMAVKTDMSKTYDRVEWDFLYAVQQRLGFHPKWIN